jgi:hypothetical protein
MKKLITVILLSIISSICFAIPKADITLKFSKLRVDKDSVVFQKPVVLEFKSVTKTLTDVQRIGTIGEYDIGVAIKVYAYGIDKTLKKMGMSQKKGWLITKVFYYRDSKNGTNWIEITSTNTSFPMSPGSCVTTTFSQDNSSSEKKFSYFATKSEDCAVKAK